jgi:hypothetical protein
VRPLFVVGEAEGVELRPESGETDHCRPLAEPALEGLMEALDSCPGSAGGSVRRSSGGLRARQADTRSRCVPR